MERTTISCSESDLATLKAITLAGGYKSISRMLAERALTVDLDNPVQPDNTPELKPEEIYELFECLKFIKDSSDYLAKEKFKVGRKSHTIRFLVSRIFEVINRKYNEEESNAQPEFRF
jgi:hypothetical protein